MKRNMEIGIDLGTTNSEIAVICPIGNVEIIKNIFNDEFTPSVFGIDKTKNKVVGKKAYERLYKNSSENETKNNKAEIKRLMGTSETVFFERISKAMTPEVISAEILKTLKEDSLRKYPNLSTLGAVITIPAHFSTLQAEATKRAGNLAGFEHVVLIQEPIAAAIAYGFMNSQNENWLVFDLGGGTFDVALISSNDGVLTVLGHHGDNFLGGKDFDLALIDKIFIPKILDKFTIKDFNRGNKNFSSVFSKLKYTAETTKIILSQTDETVIEVEEIGDDDNGAEIYLSFTFSRSDFELLIKPFIDTAIDLTLETVKDSGVRLSSISKIILVGGPTMIPYVRKRLVDDLKIEVDTSCDPLTVVAKGACIYASSQRIPDKLLRTNEQNNQNDSKVIKLNYESMTSETEETITGIIDELKDCEDDFYIQIQSEGGFFSGKKQKLRNGKFIETISLEKNKSTLFWVYVYNSNGNLVTVSPDSFSITHGMSISGAPIPHSIGVGLVKKDFSSHNFDMTEEFDVIFEKNSILPLKETRTYRTAKKLIKGNTENVLPIKVREGESLIPDQNNFICDLKVSGETIPYDLPEGTEINLTIAVNESRQVSVEAYIPIIDLSFSARATIYAEQLSIDEMELQLTEQIEKAKQTGQLGSDNEQDRIKNLIQSVANSLQTARVDEDEKRKADSQLKNLKIKLDQLQKNKKLPQLILEFKELVESIGAMFDEYYSERDMRVHNDQFTVVKIEGEKAIESQDEILLSKIVEQLKDLKNQILFLNPSSWLYLFNSLKEKKQWLNDDEARYYVQKGEKAIELNDVEELKRSTRSLLSLLPQNEQEFVTRNLSGIMR
jgi:molecular chaperone DnaK